jgi:hypothetical protein
MICEGGQVNPTAKYVIRTDIRFGAMNMRLWENRGQEWRSGT